MRNNPLDDIIKCNIEISAPASNDATFDSILLVVAAPEAEGEKKTDKVFAVSKADELLDYGYTVESNAYKATSVAFSQSPSPSELFICVKGTDESIEATLKRASTEASWYGFHLTEFREAEDVQSAVAWAEANEKLFGFEYTDYEACPVENFEYFRSFGVFSGLADGYAMEEQPKENEFAALALMAKCFGYDPGSETWHLKPLSIIIPSLLDTDQKKALDEKHINTFLRYAKENILIGGMTLAGEWIDVIRFRDWLKAEMQTNVFSAIKNNKKVPFTDNGIGLIEGKMEETLSKGQAIGGIAPTEYDSNDIAIPGYTVYVPRANELSEGERKSRRLTGCRWSARLAGAIHLVEIDGYLTF